MSTNESKSAKVATGTGSAAPAASASAVTVRQPAAAASSASAPAPASASASAGGTAGPASTNSVVANNTTYRLPSDLTFQHAAKLAIVDDKPIMMDYWTDSIDRKALIGVKDSGEKLLVKSGEEYTSPISKFYKSGSDYIVVTENSIYLVGSEIPTRKIA